MKKLFSLILVLILAIPVANAQEILFREIPWGVTFSDVKDSLTTDFYILGPYESTMIKWNGIDDVDDVRIFFDAIDGYYLQAFPSSEIKVGGYSLSNLEMYFVWDIDTARNTVLSDINNSQFYFAQYKFDVIDAHATYSDLKEKLSLLYGIGDENSEGAGSGFSLIKNVGYQIFNKYTIWSGDNDTAVMLKLTYHEPEPDSNDDTVSIIYANLSYMPKIDEIQKILLDEALEEENKQREESKNDLADSLLGL